MTAPDLVDVVFEAPARPAQRAGGPGRRPIAGRVAGPIPMAAASLDAELLEALARQDLSLAETVHLRTGPAMATRRSLPQEASARLTVPVGPGEDAVVLLEQAEVYSWSLPAARLAVPAGARRAGGAVDQVAFDLPLGPVAPDRTDRRMLGGALLAPVRAYVFRFVGRRLVDGAVRIQEHNVRPGLVRIAGRDPAAWAAGEPIVPAAPKAGGRHRVLLAIHGTFSSTAGGFGQLGPTAWGGAFLNACQARYDLVLGYDHRTLSETPAENAVALLAALRGLDWGGGAAPEIDVVAHSRGGLVARWLIEALAPGSGWGAVFRRAILVGATNGGTELARPENWSAFLDLYTNLAVAACRALTFLPQAAPVATILAETIATLGEFVKQIPLSGLDSGVAPGLFAMTPDNPFLKDLNGLQPGQFAAADAIYHVVSSSFAPTLFGTDHQPKEFPLRLVQVLGSSTVTALMRGAENDLVVDTPSMSAIDSAFGDFVRDTLHFAASPQIYHTNYFARPEVVNALTRWLDLAAADVPAAGARRGGGRAPAALPELGRGRTDLPAAVETDILVADPARNAPEFLAELAAKAPSFVVLESGGPESGRLAHVFDPSELTTVLDGAAGPVASALGLPDRTGDVVVPASRIARATGRGQSVFPSGLTASRDRLTRLVVSSEAGPVGVVPNAAEVVLDGDIGSLAAGVAASTDRILTRRAMPTFTWSGTARLEGGQFGGGRPRPGGTSPIQGRRGLAAEGGSPAPSLPDTVTPLAQDSSPSPDDQPGPETAECHIQAESPSKVKVGATLTVSVAVSRTAIEATMAENAMGIAVVDPGRPITINVLPKTGFTFGNDEEPAEIRLPPVGKVEQIYFDLKAAETGKGEIWVVARQGKLPLLTLKLEPEVIAAKARASTKKLSRGASASLVRGPDPDHTLTIIEVERTEAGTTFRFEFNSPILDKIQIDKIRVPGNRDIFVEELYHEIENYWINNSRDADNFRAFSA
ncbi:DUF7379 domain-containing protein [Methylobacterium platani]|uniref:DUF7379 domain-containing protein n=1 Tax=Methylobacterium platani TaxID=427683 RepID=UPI0012E297C8|nr:hypothetical protein [Methylobacterium platani]